VACAAARLPSGMVNICLTILFWAREIPMPWRNRRAADDAAAPNTHLAARRSVTTAAMAVASHRARLINPVRRIEARPDPDVEERETIRARAGRGYPPG